VIWIALRLPISPDVFSLYLHRKVLTPVLHITQSAVFISDQSLGINANIFLPGANVAAEVLKGLPAFGDELG
jgi:hypothetical protein